MRETKILFINPKIKGEVVRSYFPLGVAYLSSVLKKAGFFNIKFLDYNFENQTEKENEIIKWQPDFIGLTMIVPSFSEGKKKIEYLKDKIPEAKIFVGGIAAAVITEDVLNIKGVDGVYRGEGENAIVDLVKKAIKDDWRKLSGVSYLKDDKMVSNSLPVFLDNLDKIPFPDRTLILTDQLFHDIHGTHRQAVSLMTSRGCPFDCTFCYRGPAAGKKFRTRTAKNIVLEMEQLEKNYGVNAFMFWDDNFLLDRKRVFEFCDLIKSRDYHWKCQMRVDSVDVDLMKIMKDAGLVAVNIGIESGNEDVLKFLKKGITKNQAREALRLCKMYDIFSNIYFILGTPWDTLETMKESVEFAKELDPNEAHFFEAAPYPGTEMRRVAIEMDLKMSDNWGDFLMKKANPSLMENKNFTREEFKDILFEANNHFNGLKKKMK